jgi:cell shape-determining protein MreC
MKLILDNSQKHIQFNKTQTKPKKGHNMKRTLTILFAVFLSFSFLQADTTEPKKSKSSFLQKIQAMKKRQKEARAKTKEQQEKIEAKEKELQAKKRLNKSLEKLANTF